MSSEVTYFRFLSEVRAFLAKLLKNPIDAQPSKYLKDNGVSRKWLIDNLIKREVLERHEKILDSTNSDEKKAKYVVKFKVRKKDFERRIYKIYIKKFENNVNESVFADSVGGETSRGDVGYDVPFGQVQRRVIGGRPKEKKNDNGVKPENVLGKTLVAEKKARRIFVTEEQLKTIFESEVGGATTTFSVASQTSDGQIGPVRPGCMTFKKPDGSADDSAFEREPGFSVRRIGDK